MCSVLTHASPIINPCSSNDFIKLCELSPVTEYAAVFPCGDVSLVLDVCKTWLMFIGTLLPPNIPVFAYAGR